MATRTLTRPLAGSPTASSSTPLEVPDRRSDPRRPGSRSRPSTLDGHQERRPSPPRRSPGQPIGRLTPDQQRLVADHLHLIDVAASKYAGRVHANDLDDIAQRARVGLVEAARDFQPDRGVKFEQFARWRVIGAAASYFRTDRGLQRQERTGIRMLPFDAEDSDGERIPGETTVPADGLDETAAAQRTAEFIDWALRGMPRRLQRIVRLKYIRGKTLAEIGGWVGLSTSRVGQLLMEAEDLLRERWTAGEAWGMARQL